MLKFVYDRLILAYPKTVLLAMLLLVAALGYEARNLEIDASAETLTLENDKDLQFTRLVAERYGSSDFLVISYIPNEDLFADAVLADLASLRDELEALDGVESVLSILDVPLLESPPRPIKELVGDVQTLESPTIDKELARQEFQNSPIYRNLLVSPDLRTTALQVNLHDDPSTKSCSRDVMSCGNAQRRVCLRQRLQSSVRLRLALKLTVMQCGPSNTVILLKSELLWINIGEQQIFFWAASV